MKHPNSWVWVVGRFFLGGIFFYAGFSKLIEPVENFRGIIAEYQVIPFELIGPVAYNLPWIELVAGFFLILGFLPRLSALLLGFISFSFLVFDPASFYKVHTHTTF